jgi:beta-glucosidase
MNTGVTAVFLIASLIYSSFKGIPPKVDKEIYWNWNEIRIDATDIATRIKRHQPNFIWGTATAAHQVEGNNTNNWSEWENIPGKIRNGDKSGPACEHYTRYRDDIQLMKNLNVRSYRFSIEWSRIQPTAQRGVFNAEAVRHYHNVIDALLAQGIVPMITLHHYSNPVWFQNLQEFQHYENIIWFEEFSEYVFAQYAGKVKLWCTFNEVMAYVLAGHVSGSYPPGKRNLQLSMNVLRHIMIAHTNVYHKLKKMPHGSEAKIGLVKEYHQFDAVPETNLVAQGIASIADKFYIELILEYSCLR